MALAAERMDAHSALQEQAGPAGVEGGGILDADTEQALGGIEIEAEQDAGVEEMAGQFLGRVALDGQFFGPIFEVAADFFLAAGGEDAAPVEDEDVLGRAIPIRRGCGSR